MTALVRMCRRLSGVRLVPTSVRLAHLQNENSSEFSRFLGADIEFDAGVDELAFAPAIKPMRLVSADPYLNQLLIENCEAALSARPTNRGSFQSRVENAIAPLLPHGKVSSGEIAQRLGVSKRTLARQLSIAGVSYLQVLENLRSNLAERYLTDEGLSISQIAWLLGYQEVSSFTHAFKRWTGKTPGEARSRIASH